MQAVFLHSSLISGEMHLLLFVFVGGEKVQRSWQVLVSFPTTAVYWAGSHFPQKVS